MRLPDEIVQEIAGPAQDQAEDPGTAASALGRRQARRSPCSTRVTLLPLLPDGRPGTPSTASVEDVSPAGIAMITTIPLRRGDRFFLRHARKSGPPIWIECEVVRWQPINAQACLVGASFTRIVEPAARAVA